MPKKTPLFEAVTPEPVVKPLKEVETTSKKEKEKEKEKTASSVRLIHFPQVEMTKGDLVLEITGNEGYIGRLYLSRGSIDFLPRDKRYDTLSLSWDKFARVMEKLDTKRRKKRKDSKKKSD